MFPKLTLEILLKFLKLIKENCRREIDSKLKHFKKASTETDLTLFGTSTDFK
jgi:hypothetical protein